MNSKNIFFLNKKMSFLGRWRTRDEGIREVKIGGRNRKACKEILISRLILEIDRALKELWTFWPYFYLHKRSI